MSDFDEFFFSPSREKRKKIREKLSSSLECQVIGKSILGEAIDLYKAGSGKRNILLVGAHHGSEHITASLLYKFLNDISLSGRKLFDIDKELFLSMYTLFVVPMLNPDGVELSITGEFDNPLRERQRKMVGNGDFLHWNSNARGVDLNHNYSVGFGEYKLIERKRNITAGATLYSGEYPESEPESRALANLARSINFSLSVSLHSQGEEIYCFPSCEDFCDDKLISRASEIALMCGSYMAKKLGYIISKPTGTASYGGFSDFTAGELEIPSLTIEVGKGTNPLPYKEYSKIKERFSEALVGVALHVM